MKSMQVIGVGDADVDIYLDVDHLPGRDEKILARELAFHPGGMVANFLVALSRLGISCGFHGPVGDDEFGGMVMASMSSQGVDTSGTVVKPGERTYFCTVLLDSSGEKALTVAPTNCLSAQPEDISEAVIAQARHLHTTAANMSAAIKAARLAKQHGLTVSMDIEPDNAARITDFNPLLAQVDIAFVNQRAVKFLGESDSLEAAALQVLSYGPQIVCITMGANGSLAVSAAETFRANAFPVQVVDSTGAGDCFAAGFVYGFLMGWPLAQTATFASAVGALSVTHRGGHSNLPNLAQVMTFLADRGVKL